MCKDRKGAILCNKDEIIDRWAEYFDELLNVTAEEDQVTSEGPEEERVVSDVPPPSFEETLKAIRSLKNNRTPGSDGINAEMLKSGGEELDRRIHRLVTKVWQEEVLPEEWNIGIICPLHKKGDRLNCANYRGVTLLSTVYKVLSTILQKRLNPIVEVILGEYQCGFRSTTDQIFNLRQVMEKMKEHGQSIHQLFIDFKQAYDSINRNALWKAMAEFGIPAKYIRMVKATLTRARSCVRVQGDLSNTFEISSGVRQGDGLSSLLFNIALEKVIRMARLDRSGTIFHKSQQVLAFADDIDIMGRSERDIAEAFTSLVGAASPIGLQINIDKTKYMKMSNKPDTSSGNNITIEQQDIKVVQNFRYLGTNVNAMNSI